jgi:hypothetical protein
MRFPSIVDAKLFEAEDSQGFENLAGLNTEYSTISYFHPHLLTFSYEKRII